MKKHKKSRLLTYFLSFIPGVGYMYRGWMKKGFSYLTLFLCTLSGLSWLGMDILMIIPVLIWFYAFFDQINTFSLSEEESKEVEDESIFHSYIARLNQDFIKNHHSLVGGLIMILGGYLLIKNVYFTMIIVLPESMQVTLHSMMDLTPQLILACMILYCGGCLLQGNQNLIAMFHKSEEQRAKKREVETLIAKTNVVYYMEEGKLPANSQEIYVAEKVEGVTEKPREQEEQEEQRFAEILEQTSREQLIRKAKVLLDDEIYQAIHRENATAMEENITVNDTKQEN